MSDKRKNRRTIYRLTKEAFPAVRVLNAMQLVPGATYWIMVGEPHMPPTSEEQINAIRDALVAAKTGCHFIVTPFAIRPVAMEEVRVKEAKDAPAAT